jgi:PAS domain S-box-containing protein
LIAGFYDVTARRQAEEALRESEERWRSLSENAPDIITTVDQEGTILAINRTVPGFSVEEVVGSTVYDYIEEEYHDRVRRVLRDTFEGGDSGHIEVLGTGPFGAMAWYDVRSGAVMRDGRVAGATWIATDVTERKATQDELRQSEELYSAVVQNVDEVIYMVALDNDPLTGLLRFASARTKDILGYDPDEFQRDPTLWFRNIHRDDRSHVLESTRQAFARGESTVREYRLRHKDSGAYVWLEDKIVPQVDGAGNTVAFLGVARDITSRKRMERRFRRIAQTVERKVEDRMPKEKRYGLTFREMAVLQLVASGQSDKEIATLLNISPRTAHVHVGNVLRKMNARSRTEAAVRAVKEGLAT